MLAGHEQKDRVSKTRAGHTMKWKFLDAQKHFERHQDAWDELNRAIDGHILLSSAFWKPLVRYFPSKSLLLGIAENKQYPAMILVEQTGLGMWRTFQPAQAPIGPILLGNQEKVEWQIHEILKGLPGLALAFGVTQQDQHFGPFRFFSQNPCAEKMDYITTARISVDGDFEQYWDARGKDLKVNMRKRLRRLDRDGLEVHLDVYEASQDMKSCIEQYGMLEGSGWKGREGTAVTSDNTQGKFYIQMLQALCQNHEGVVFSLRFNDNVVAQKLCVRRNGMIVFLKMAYDEHFRTFAPGYVLQYEVLKRLFADPSIHFAETYGRVNEGWTDKWTNDFRMMYHFNFFRNSSVKSIKQYLRDRQIPSPNTNYENPVTASTASRSVPNGSEAGITEKNIAKKVAQNVSRTRQWDIYDARESFGQYRTLWDELNQNVHQHPLLDSMFVEPLVKHFASSSIYLAISKKDEYPGILLLEDRGKGFWQTFQPSQAPIGLILLGTRRNLSAQIQDLIASLPGFGLGLSVTQQDPDYSVFSPFDELGDAELVPYITTPRISLTGTFEEYWKSRGKDLTRNLARRKKKILEELGEISIVVNRDPKNIPENIRVYGDLEESGWKGSEGTAVAAHNAQGRFYRDMLQEFCSRGEGIVYQLLVDGKPIASDLCVERNGMLIVLKIAYDEQFKNVSPSFVLREQVIQKLYTKKKIQVVEFYGRAREWHEKWTSEIRNMCHLNYYRHRWIQKGREMLKASGVGLTAERR